MKIRLSMWEIGWLLGIFVCLPFQFERFILDPDQLIGYVLSFIILAFLPRIWNTF